MPRYHLITIKHKKNRKMVEAIPLKLKLNGRYRKPLVSDEAANQEMA
jgi:hypothetical protein